MRTVLALAVESKLNLEMAINFYKNQEFVTNLFMIWKGFSSFKHFQIIVFCATSGFSSLRWTLIFFTDFVGIAFTSDSYMINFFNRLFLQSIYSGFLSYFVVISNILKLFARTNISLLAFLAIFLENSIKHFLISFWRSSHLDWWFVMPSLSKILKVVFMLYFILVTKSEFVFKELLNFHEPLPPTFLIA